MSTKLDSYSLGPINNDTNADWLFKRDFNIASSLSSKNVALLTCAIG